jgi:hypothetical protein
MKEALKKLGTEGLYLKIINATSDKPAANITLNREKLKAFPLKSGMRKGCTFSPLLLNTILKFLVKAIKQQIRCMQIE